MCTYKYSSTLGRGAWVIYTQGFIPTRYVGCSGQGLGLGFMDTLEDAILGISGIAQRS